MQRHLESDFHLSEREGYFKLFNHSEDALEGLYTKLLSFFSFLCGNVRGI